jgi:NADH-quinone oxidoreductase subunit L
VLAYSTISQIGYMFLALGVGAWSAAIFHFMIHAFFKALLFLAGGAVIMALHHEHDMFKMGGLRKKLPVVYWTFLIGSASLAALPIITAGFYSKDQILWLSLAGENGNAWLFICAMLGAFVTSIYTFRMVFLTFFGESKTEVSHPVGNLISIPLIVLAVLSLVGGFIELPHTFGHVTVFSDMLGGVLPGISLKEGIESWEWLVQVVTAGLGLGGIYIAYYFYVKKPELSDRMKASAPGLHKFWLSGWGFDELYDTLFVKPFVWISNINKSDLVDKIYTEIADTMLFYHRLLSSSQNGVVRWYMMGIVIGVIVLLTIGLMS